MVKISWGILSTANIGVSKVIPGIQKARLCKVDAICSRNISVSSEVAVKLGIPKAFGSYEEMLADKTIDAVYNPLPNHMHVEWTKKCMAAGKHVLCEKPIGLNAADAADLLAYSKKYPHIKVMEAFMYRFHPQWSQVKAWVTQGKIGKVIAITSHFSYYNVDPTNVRNRVDIGGGGLLDIGCYNISLSRFLLDKEPTSVQAQIERDPELKTDKLVSAILDFDGVPSNFICSTQMTPFQRVWIFGDQGRIEMDIPFNAPVDKSCAIHLHNNEGSMTEQTEVVDQYSLQAEAFAHAILTKSEVPTPLTDAVDNMKVIDAVFKAGEDKGVVYL